MRRAALALVALLALFAPAAPLGAQPAAPLTALRFDLVGARLVVDPPSLTVPKDIPTAISTALALPAGLDASNALALQTLAASAEVVAELRGPSLPAQEIRVRAGEPIPIPPLPLAGEYRLDRIRLEKDGATLLDGTPASVPIQVIDKVLVTSVTTRPLSLDELQERGVLIDESNFNAYSFELTLDVDGAPLRIDLPVVYPRFDLNGLRQRPPAETIEFALELNRELASLATVELPPEIERPGLDISILAVPFFPVDDEGNASSFGAPPLVGLVVIPGQVAFLNGFFSALVQVENVAPDDSRLSVRDVTATISLPTGDDRTPGTPEDPGDDPLRLARFDGGAVHDRVAVLGAGPDATAGTADDDARLEPGESGQGEFVIEGRSEGSHAFDVALDAVLEGLPTGPVEMHGTAAGAVLVRNPTFSVAFSHPRTVRASEPYDLFVTVTNTSADVANLVSVQLDERSVSGARLDSDDTVTFETLAPYESGTARFRLTAQQTGSVTATYLRTAAGLEGGLSLRTGVDERDVPLQPDQIALPRDTEALPDALVVAAQRVLGQTLGVARAPAGTLPPDVLPIRYSTLTERGRALGLAGQRVDFGDTLLRSVADLVLDWSDAPADTGFDQLLRGTDAGADFLAAAGAALGDDPFDAPLDRFDAIADALAPRAPPPFVFAAARAGPPVAVLDDDPASLQVPLSDAALAFAEPGVNVLGVNLLRGAGGGESRVDVGVALPLDPAGVVVLHFDDVSLPAGATARLEGDPAAPATLRLVVDRDGDGRSDASVAPSLFEIPDRAPGVIAARQLDTSIPGRASDIRDPAYHGLLFAVLFDEPVEAATITELSRWSVEANGVRDVAVQPGGRLVRVLLEKGIGTWIPRKVAIDGATDLRGNVAARIERTIEAILSDGGDLSGQVQGADGTPVGGGRLLLTVVEGLTGFTPSSIDTDAQGRFAFDFVRRTHTGYILLAQHPTTGETATARGSIRGAGDSVYTRVLFQARGSVRGRVLGLDGAPVEGAEISLRQSFGEVLFTLSDAAGEWSLADVPVGGVTVRAVAPSGEQGAAEGFLDAPGDEAVVDVVLTTVPSATGDVAGRVFDSDGATPVAGAAVYIGSYDRLRHEMSVLAQTTSDEVGAFRFASIPGNGGQDVVALDAGSGRFGVTSVALVRVGTTTAVNVVFEATGTVTGTVRDAFGNPVAGALVSGGTAIATTDAQGRFSTGGVPAGLRTVEAANPVTKRRGSAQVTVPPGGTAEIEILLEARASIVGVVRDAAGNPVPNVTVRLPRSGGFFFVFANEAGRFLFPDMPVDDYLVEAPGPPRESLIQWMEDNGIPLEAAFTLGVPPELGGSGPPPANDERAVLRAYANAVTALFSATDRRLETLPDPPPGGFGWSRATLVNDQQIEDGSVEYLPMGSVAGTTVDAHGDPIAAAVRIASLVPGATGNPIVKELARVQTEPLVGSFGFDGLIARFDLETFQRAGVRSGDFRVEGFESFTRSLVRESGRLDTANPDRLDLVLQFGGDDLVHTVSGTVFLPDGETPAPENTEVFVPIDATGVTVRTDAAGHYVVEAPIRAGTYDIVATEPASGLTGDKWVVLEAGEDAVVDLRLLGLGGVDVRVLRPDGSAVENAHAIVERSSFPRDRAEGDGDGGGHVRLVNLTEGAFAVSAEDLSTGLSGRANGTILRDGVIAVDVVVQAAGTVTGRVVGPTGATPVADVQVMLSVGGVNAFTRSDADGRFAFESIPVGRFAIDTEDPKSGRRGTASGELRFQGDRTDVLVRQTGLGVVEGRVLTSSGEPVAGADVSIGAAAGSVTTSRQSAADGSFRFGAVGEGPFTLHASDPVSRFEGSASGELRFEGETVQRDVVLEAFGAIDVQVIDAGGAAVGNAEVRLIPQRGTSAHAQPVPSAVDPNGHVRFEFLPVGAWTVEARSLADPNDRGRVVALVDATHPVEQAIVALRGTGSVAVTVHDASGAPAPGARVVLNARGHLDDEPPLPFGVEMIAGAEADGVAHFAGVPRGGFDVRAELGTVAGVANGAIEMPGAAEDVLVELGPAGSVVGRAILPDGATPAFEAVVTLRFTPRTTLHSGVLQVRTDLDGRFEFGGIPLGPFSVDLFEPVSLGLAHRDASFDASGPTGQQIDLGAVVLDATSPRVIASEPIDGASGVAPDAAIALVFSEPMLTTSLRTSVGSENVIARIGATRVEGSFHFEDGDRRLVLQPRDPLPSSALVTITVDGAPDGPRDLVQLPVPDRFVASFQVADVISPAIADASPAADAIGVRLDSVLRVAFDEAMDPGLAIAVEDGDGAAVAGDTALALGGTVAIFTPRAFLDANQTYRARFSAVRDVAGNAIETGFDGAPLGGAPLELAFATLDTIPPSLERLDLAGTPSRIEGSSVRVVPALPDADAVQVVYRVAGSAPVVVTADPFALDLVLPRDVAAIDVTAEAVDAAGNRSGAKLLSIPIESDLAPNVALVPVTPEGDIAAGASVAVRLVASDDVGLASVAASASGAFTASEVRAPGGAVGFDAVLQFAVPASAATGAAFEIGAGASDLGGSSASAAPLHYAVRDGSGPVVAIPSPVAGAQVVPGETLDVVVTAQDVGGVRSVTLSCTPVAAGCEARSLAAAPAATTQHFAVVVPPGLVAPDAFTLIASAVDAAGNPSASSAASVRALRAADATAPVVVELAAPGGALVAPGQVATLHVRATDAVGVRSLRLVATGAAPPGQERSIAPALADASADFSITVPDDASDGAAIELVATARDAALESAPRSLTLHVQRDATPPVVTVLEPAPDTAVRPGTSVLVRVHAEDDRAVARVEIAASGAFTAVSASDAVPPLPSYEPSLFLNVPADAAPGAVSLRAAAIDAAGNRSEITLPLRVRDVAAPVVTIAAPLEGAEIDPRAPLSVEVEAQDGGTLANLHLSVSGAAGFDETRPVTGSSAAASFDVRFAAAPAEGGTLSLTATAADADGNVGSAVRSLAVRDVVPPSVVATTPLAGATDVPLETVAEVVFSESMDSASLAAALRLETTAGAPVAAGFALSANGRTAQLTPAVPLAPATDLVLRVAASATDRHGLALAAPLAVAFRTAQPDIEPPRVLSTQPADGATDVSLTAAINVRLSEPLDCASVDDASFQLVVDGAPVAGTRRCDPGQPWLYFTPAVALPLEANVAIQLTNGLRDRAGLALVAPYVFHFSTGAFSLVRPRAGEVWIEGESVRLLARRSPTLPAGSVRFEVDGAAIDGVGAPDAEAFFVVPPAAEHATLHVVAVALRSDGSEIARDEVDVAVGVGLAIEPFVAGVPLGGTARVHLRLSSAAPAELPVTLVPLAAGVIDAPAAAIVIPAGEREADALLRGLAPGATGLRAESSLAIGHAVASVSAPVSGRALQVLGDEVGAQVRPATSAGTIAVAAGATQAVSAPFLPAPAASGFAVAVSSSDASVATAPGGASVAAGSQQVRLDVVAGVPGVATLRLAGGGVVRTLTVVVGEPPPGLLPVALAPLVGAAVQRAPSLGTAVLATGSAQTLSVVMLDAPSASPPPLIVTTSDASVAVIEGTPHIEPGTRIAVFSVRTGASGRAELTLRAGGVVRSFSVVAGTPPEGSVPLVVAPLVGARVATPASLGTVFVPVGASLLVPARLLAVSTPSAVPVAVSSDRSDVATVAGAPVVAAGSDTALLDVRGVAAGRAVLEMHAGLEVRRLTVVVGDPSEPSTTLAPPVGVEIPLPTP